MLSSTCTHRGAQLSKGWVETVNGESCVRCPYHAWAYSGDGKVQDIPVQADGRFPKRALQQSYQLKIQGNLLWMLWGPAQMRSDEQPPVPGLCHKEVCYTTTESGVLTSAYGFPLAYCELCLNSAGCSHFNMYTVGDNGGIDHHQAV